VRALFLHPDPLSRAHSGRDPSRIHTDCLGDVAAQQGSARGRKSAAYRVCSCGDAYARVWRPRDAHRQSNLFLGTIETHVSKSYACVCRSKSGGRVEGDGIGGTGWKGGGGRGGGSRGGGRGFGAGARGGYQGAKSADDGKRDVKRGFAQARGGKVRSLSLLRQRAQRELRISSLLHVSPIRFRRWGSGS